VRCEISIPSFVSSPWMRGAPHNGLALAMWHTSAWISLDTEGRSPSPRARDRQVQNLRNPARCQQTTVSRLRARASRPTMWRTATSRTDGRCDRIAVVPSFDAAGRAAGRPRSLRQPTRPSFCQPHAIPPLVQLPFTLANPNDPVTAVVGYYRATISTLSLPGHPIFFCEISAGRTSRRYSVKAMQGFAEK
jgi:hypothetical protein